MSLNLDLLKFLLDFSAHTRRVPPWKLSDIPVNLDFIRGEGFVESAVLMEILVKLPEDGTHCFL